VKSPTTANPEVQAWTIKLDGNPISPEVDTYNYKCFNVPEYILDAHIVAFVNTGVFQTNVSVHHAQLAGCQAKNCIGRKEYLHRSRFNFADYSTLPEEAGYRIGSSEGTERYQSLRLALHYSNPDQISGDVDSFSGLIIFYTTKLRKHNAAVLELGDGMIKQRGKVIPGGLSKWTFSCPKECTAKYISTPLTVYKSVLHMHSFGHQMYTEQFRNGRSLGIQSQIQYFQPQSQEFSLNIFKIEHGDHLETTCIYDSDGSARMGMKSEDEMCVNHFYYYPRIEIDHCGHKSVCGYSGPHSWVQFDDRTFGKRGQSAIQIVKRVSKTNVRLGESRYEVSYKNVTKESY